MKCRFATIVLRTLRRALYECYGVVCVWGVRKPRAARGKLWGYVKAAGITETACDGAGTAKPKTEPVHKGRNGMSNGTQSNPSLRKKKGREGGGKIFAFPRRIETRKESSAAKYARRQNTRSGSVMESIPITRNGTGQNPHILYLRLSNTEGRLASSPCLASANT
jgi:hypothetical protein